MKKQISVWVVEDNALFRKTLATIVNDQSDMRCDHEFSSCERAIEALKSEKQPDVVLQDIGFPGLSGVQCVEAIKRRYPDTQVIMVTVYDDSDHIFSSICAGATGYLLKTEQSETIVRSVRDVLNGGSPMNSSIARKALEVFAKMHTVGRDYGLSEREKEILDQIVKGYGNRKIAQQFNISPHTIDAHLRKIYEKLQVHSRTEATAKALRERLT